MLATAAEEPAASAAEGSPAADAIHGKRCRLGVGRRGGSR